MSDGAALLRAEGQDLLGDLTRIRRELHREPEIGLMLPRTQERVLAELRGLPLEITTGREATSVTAVLRGGRRDPGAPTTVLLRGDMDALPLREETGLDFASVNDAMHACGHDLHTTALIGAARLLSAHREALCGDVVFMFQPGEEGCDGAAVMIAEGVLAAAGRRPDHAYGLHVTANQFPRGVFAAKPGPLMSASHSLTVTVRGQGGHGSLPHGARDPITAAAEMITALQTMITRSFDAFDPVIVSVGMMRAGTARNIIPDEAVFEATARTFSPAAGEALRAGVRRVVDGIAAAHGVDVEVVLTDDYPVLVNDAAETAYARDTVTGLFGDDRWIDLAQPIGASEDFSRILAEVPGVFVLLGASPDADYATAPSNHSPHARFDDAVLADAAVALATLAAGRLQAHSVGA